MKYCKTIVKKEIIEILRDKTTILFLLIPFLLFPILKIGFMFINADNSSEYKVAIVNENGEASSFIDNFFQDNKQYSVVDCEMEEADNILKKGDVNAVILIYNNKASIMYYSSFYKSVSVSAKLREQIEGAYLSFLDKTDNSIINISIIDEKGYVDDPMNNLSIYITPIVFVILAFQGVASYSNSMFAGEKERGTLEILFSSCPKRKTIFFGKFITIFLIAIVNISIGFFSLCLSFKNNYLGESLYKNVLFILKAYIILLLLSLFSSTVSAGVSICSKNMRSAQILNEIVVSIPLGISVLIAFGISKKILALYFLPMYGMIYSLCDTLRGKLVVSEFLIAIAVNAFWCILIMILSIRQINTEKMIR